MECSDVALNRYYDGELTGEEKRAVGEHLEGCEACREQLMGFAKLDGWIEKSSPVLPSRSPYRIKAMAAAAAMLLCVGGFTYWTTPKPHVYRAQAQGGQLLECEVIEDGVVVDCQFETKVDKP